MHDLLSELSSLNVRMEVRDGRLHISAPNGALTQSLRERIQLHRDALLELLTEPRQETTNDVPAIEIDVAQRHEPFVLNEVQHAYWVGRQGHIELGNVSSHIYFELNCIDLDLARLNAAFNRVIAQHDMLRAVVDSDGRQRILSHVDEYVIAAADLRGLGEAEREDALIATRGELSERQIACDHWPLFELRAAHVSDRLTRLFLSWDFIFLDAWSLLLVFKQWNQCYRDPDHRLDPPGLSFRDYVLAEAASKSLPSYRTGRRYWWNRIDSMPAAPRLPLSAGPGQGQAQRFTRRQFELAPALWQALKERAHQSGLTPSSVLLAAFAEILNRWSRCAHYCLSLTLFHRRDLHADVGKLVGDFTNLLLLEVDGREGRSFLERARQIQERFLSDLDHRQVSAVEVLRELARRRGESLKAIAPVVFTSTLMLEGTDGADGGLEQFGQLGWGISQTPQVWLDYQIFERNGALMANWDAVDAIFLPGVLDAMFEANRALLEVLANDSSQWTSTSERALPLEQQQRRELLDATDAELPEGCLHDGFVRRALAHPAHIAVRDATRSLTYGECYAQACALSLKLQALGAGPNQLIAVVMDKGWEQVVAVLAVLMSGAAYLPIDPRWPQLRREDVLARTDTRIVLTQRPVDERLGWPASLTRIVVAEMARLPVPALPSVRQQSSDLAYVIFTSGSTGSPKGVMIDHRAALNTVFHVSRLFGMSEHDRVLALSDLSFDLSVFDIFGTLAAGGTLVMPDAKAGRDPGHWCSLVRDHGVTVWNSAPQLMSIAVDHASADGDLRSLRLVMLSGDWIPTHLPDRVRAIAPDAEVVSLGGATEGAIWSIYYPIGAVDPHWDSIPYGRALPNQRMWVLDERMQTCPDYVTGQICIGGHGVALGYWRDAVRSGQQFVPHRRTGERVYLTGDLGRYLPDGNIEFLGREDSQVKLRGYRVELGEIVAALQAHPGVRDAAVRVVSRNGRSSLWAYVVAELPRVDSLFEINEVLPDRTRAATVALVQAATTQTKAADLPVLEEFAQFWRLLDQVCLAAMAGALQDLGTLDGTDFGLRLDALEAEGRVLPAHRRLLNHWLSMLEREGWVAREDDGFRVPPGRTASLKAVDTLLGELAATLRDDAGTRALYDYVAICLRSLPELLDGRKGPLQLLYPGDDWRHSEALYERNPAIRQHNAVLAAIVRGLVSCADADAPLRVLEVGAGGGGTTRSVLPELPSDRTEYRYTDISPYFFAKARDRFGHAQFLDCSVLDLDKNPVSLGHIPHSYDLIIAANALHNAADLNATLGFLCDLLQPGGHLLLLEGTRNTPWSLATVGFLEGVRTYRDQRASLDIPILDPSGWRSALQATGFEAIHVLPDDVASDPALLQALDTAMPQHVLVARGPGRVARFQPQALSAFLAERLPDYMVPQHYVLLDHLPLSSNGKLALDQLPSGEDGRSETARTVVPPDSPLEKQLIDLWKRVLGIPQVGISDNFFDLGGDSLQLTELQRQVSALLGRSLPIADLFSHPNVRALAQHLRSLSTDVRPLQSVATTLPSQLGPRDIAVIGLAGRFPDAASPDALWRNIAAGHCAVRSFSDEELLEAGVRPDELQAPGYVKAAPVLADMDRFDAAYFGISPAEAEIMDPQQRFLLETAVEALEHAGYPDESKAGRVGVFAGKGIPLYLVDHVLGRPDLLARFGLHALLREHEKDHAAPMISYRLNLTGPSLSVNTTCSTSLVAVHAACQSLLAGECEVALAGGAGFVTTLPKSGYQHHEGQILSPDGHCRAFSDRAEGTIFACGAGLVVLKPLAAALRDNDTIHAVIKGTAVNNDGDRKVGYTAPSREGQARVIAQALSSAGVSADTVQYVEAHGTGTSLGDPVEFGALREIYGGPRAEPATLGTLKSNIGHLDTAAGIAGMIKVILALRNRQVPPTLHAGNPSRQIDWSDSAFELNPALREWRRGEHPRRGAVSSFGVGGTNAHAILEEPPAAAGASSNREEQLLVLSAVSEAALHRQAKQLGEHLRHRQEGGLDRTCFTLQAGRRALPYALYVVCADHQEAQSTLEGAMPTVRRDELMDQRVVFLFPGQGVPLRGCGSDLYRRNQVFRAEFDRCAQIVARYSGQQLRGYIEAGAGSGPGEALATAVAQPLLFSLEYSLARYWQSLGVTPDAMLGHSLGEYAAACIAGVFSLDEALALVVARAQLMQSLPEGRMLAAFCSETVMKAHLQRTECCLAAINGPSQCVAAGPDEAIQALKLSLERDGVDSRFLDTSHAFHSRVMDSILDVYRECVAQVELNPPRIRFVSSMTGEWITDAQAVSPEYWAQHLRNPVRFADAIQRLHDGPGRPLIEVGPGGGLCALAKAGRFPSAHCVSPHRSRPGVSERGVLLDAVGRMWALGVDIEWLALHNGQSPGRVALPTYPFEKTRYWIERRSDRPASGEAASNTVEEVVATAQASAASHQRPSLVTAYVAPRNAVERQIAMVWGEFLRIDGIGIDDDFLDLGGDSLMGTRVRSQLAKQFDITIPLEQIFRLTTIRRQALLVLATTDPEAVETLTDAEVDELTLILSSAEQATAVR